MSESEARAQASVSGFCISDGRGMLGMLHGPWTNLTLCGWQDPNCFSLICGMGGLHSGLLPQLSHLRGIPKQSPGEERRDNPNYA